MLKRAAVFVGLGVVFTACGSSPAAGNAPTGGQNTGGTAGSSTGAAGTDVAAGSDAGVVGDDGSAGTALLVDASTADGAAAQGDGGQCLPAGELCAGRANDCCNGEICIKDLMNPDPNLVRCASTCLNAGQCASGCCKTLAEGTSAVCAPATYCATACAMANAACGQGKPDCCADSVCVTSTVTGDSCAAKCTAHAQCASGCCAPLGNTGQTVCSPALFCAPACVAAGASCAVGTCCSDSVCVQNQLGTNCAAKCITGLDCQSGCCAPVNGSPYSVCSPASLCL